MTYSFGPQWEDNGNHSVMELGPVVMEVIGQDDEWSWRWTLCWEGSKKEEMSTAPSRDKAKQAAVDVQQRFQAFIWQRGYERDAFHRMIGEAMITQW